MGERAEEVAGEFYPNGEAAAKEPVEPAIGESQRDEQLASICELARRLGYNDAKTKMVIGQSAGDLAGLERKLLNELDEDAGRMPTGNGEKSGSGQPQIEKIEATATTTSNPHLTVSPGGSTASTEGFLF